MTNPSNIMTDTNVLTANNTQTVTTKTITSANDIDASAITSGTVGTARLASGTPNSTTFLRGDQTWSSAGLTYFADAESTTSPNNTVYVDSLTVQGSSTNVDAALVAKGSGATLAQIPDGTSTGGNKRGTYATDWQKYRFNIGEVASGIYSTLSGGVGNEASGSYSVVSGGVSNNGTGEYASVVGGYLNSATNSASTAGGYSGTASGSYSTVFGYTGLASGAGAVSIGYDNDATANYAVSLGRGNVASGQYAVAIGGNNTAYLGAGVCIGSNCTASSSGVALGNYNDSTGEYIVRAGYQNLSDGLGSATFGSYTDAKERHNTIALGSPVYGGGATAGTAAIQMLTRDTTDATPTLLTSGSTTTYTSMVRMDTNSAYAFRVLVVANVTGGGDTKAWELLGCIKQGATASTTALVGSVTKTVIAADTGASSWDCDIDVDTTNGVFTVEATGAASTNIRWGATVYTTEVDY